MPLSRPRTQPTSCLVSTHATKGSRLSLHLMSTAEAVPTLPAQNGQKEEETYKYAHLLPHFSQDKYPPLVPFEYIDPGLRALKHPDSRAFLKSATNVLDLTPNLGTELRGIRLIDLDSDERDQLALETAKRGLLVFRDQTDFIDQGPETWLEWGRHFGRLHIHPTSGHPKGYPEIHLHYRDANAILNYEIQDSITTTIWHSDVSFELQPPGITTYFLLSQPRTGGDTLFSSQISVLKRLSPSFVAFLRTLSAVHSAVEQADLSQTGKWGGILRRKPVENIHPVVRRHPVTGEEALFVNKEYTTRIIGLKREESDTILKFLYDVIDKSGDLQARVKWEPGTVVLWDNRTIAHSAVIDYEELNERRHGARVTPQAERPMPAWDDLKLPN